MPKSNAHPDLVVCIALFCASQVFIVSSVSILFSMIGKANRYLPDDQQLSYLGSHPLKYQRIFQEYRRFYPQSRLVLYFHLTSYAGVALLIVFGYQLFS